MTATRKRQRTAATEVEDDTKKPRGRPRVDGQDETAADRRRTQIRLAQRAYRQRKENTISALKDRVTRLQSTIEQMSKAFLAFNDKLVSSNMLGANEELVKELQKTTQHFLLLAKSSESDSDSAESEPDGLEYQSGLPPPEPKQSPPALESSAGARQVDIGLGYVQIFDESASSTEPTPEVPVDMMFPPDALNANFQTSTTTDLQLTQQFRTDFPLFPNDSSFPKMQVDPAFARAFPSPQSYSSGAESPKLPNTLSLRAPYTFSTEESTFARRLHRASLERAYHLLATAHTRPNGIAKVFKLSLLYHSRETLMYKVRKMLTQRVDQPLEFFHTPFIHLGGAGMHYSKGRKQNAYIIKTGPIKKTARLENADTGQDAGIQFDIDWKDYEGEWFDPNDVEGYLDFLGIPINPRTAFAEAVVPESGALVNLLKENHIIKTPNPASPVLWTDSTSTPALDVSQGTLDDGAARLFPELGLGDINTFPWANDMSNAGGWLMGSGDRTPEFLASGWSLTEQPSGWDATDALNAITGIPQPSSNASRKIALDVGVFIDGMLKKGICLGRAPGFRKKDVEKALIHSLIEVS